MSQVILQMTSKRLGCVVVTGDGLARDRRAGVSARNLANGPGKLCQALEISRADDGADLCSRHSSLWICDDGTTIADGSIRRLPRIGVDYAGEAASWPLRYVSSESV